jgi:hypothetical protein
MFKRHHPRITRTNRDNRKVSSLCSIQHFTNLFFSSGSSCPFRAQDSLDEWSVRRKAATETQNKHIHKHQTSMPWVGFGPTIPAFKRTKTVHTLNRVATVTGTFHTSTSKYYQYSQNRHDTLTLETYRWFTIYYITHVHWTCSHSTVRYYGNPKLLNFIYFFSPVASFFVRVHVEE